MIRKLKIQPFVTLSKSKLAYHKKPITHPILIIKGKWFRDAGFSPEDHVDIFVSNNQLIIQRIQ